MDGSSNTDGYGVSYAYCVSYTDRYSYSHVYSYGYSDGDSYRYGYGHRYRHSYSYRYSDSYGHRYCDRDSYRYSDGYCYSDRDARVVGRVDKPVGIGTDQLYRHKAIERSRWAFPSCLYRCRYNAHNESEPRRVVRHWVARAFEQYCSYAFVAYRKQRWRKLYIFLDWLGVHSLWSIGL